MKRTITVIGIILILLLSSLSINTVGENIKSNTIIDDQDESLDQYQHEYHGSETNPYYGYVMFYTNDSKFSWWAQSFVPSMPILTRVKLFVFKNNQMDCGFIVSIRSSLYGEDLTKITVNTEKIPTYLEADWVEFDFPDIYVDAGKTYYIVAYCYCGGDEYNEDNELTRHHFVWVFGIRYDPDPNLYEKGNIFHTYRNIDFYKDWYSYNSHRDDFCFETYGKYLEPNTITVDDDGTADYIRIQDAIDNASDGDTVYVYNGEYYEIINIKKQMNLQGEDKYNTIIKPANNNSEDIIQISSDYVTISGFTFHYRSNLLFGTRSLHKPSYSYCRIENNIFLCSLILSFNYSNNNIIRNNIFDVSNEPFGLGIYIADLGNNNNNVIEKNIISNNVYGMVVGADKFTNSIYIRHNNFLNNSIHAIFGVFPIKNIINNSQQSMMEKKVNLNDFLSSNLRFTYWDGNYWDNNRNDFFKIISGFIVFETGYRFIRIPWLKFDWHPAKEPYDIPIDDS
jgi:hypothetical protein